MDQKSTDLSIAEVIGTARDVLHTAYLTQIGCSKEREGNEGRSLVASNGADVKVHYSTEESSPSTVTLCTNGEKFHFSSDAGLAGLHVHEFAREAVTYYDERTAEVLKAGLDAINGFTEEPLRSNTSDAYLLNIRQEYDADAQRQVRATLVLRKFVSELKAEGTPPEMILLDITLTELSSLTPASGPLRSLVRAIVSLPHGDPVDTYGASAKTLLSALWDNPPEGVAISLGDLAAASRGNELEGGARDLLTEREKLRSLLLNLFSSSSTVETADLREGQTIAHVIPGYGWPGLSIEIFKVRELTADKPDDANSPHFGECDSTDARRLYVASCEITGGGEGRMVIHLNEHLRPKRLIVDPLERHEVGSLFINSKDPIAHTYASVANGTFHYGAALTKLGLKLAGLTRELLPESESEFGVKVDGEVGYTGNGEYAMYNRTDLPEYVAFQAPNTWVLPEEIVEHLEKVRELYDACGDREIVALGMYGKLY